MNTVVLRQAITSLTHEHGKDATQLAAMVYCTRRTLRQAASAHGCPEAAECMIATLEQCVASYCIDKDIAPEAVHEALRTLDNDLSLTAD